MNRAFLHLLSITGAALLLVVPSTASAVQIVDQPDAELDGQVLLSPAAELVQTVVPTGPERIGPGQTIRRSVTLENRTEAPVDFTLDVAQVVGSSAELIVEVRHGVREGAAAWVQLERANLELAPGQRGTVNVVIRIPKAVQPGSKPFAVTATQQASGGPTGGAGIAPQFRQVAIFIMELPGDAPVEGSIEEASFTSATQSVEATRDGGIPPLNPRLLLGSHELTAALRYENSGERLLRPTARVIVSDLFGRRVGTYELDDFTVYPGGENAGEVRLRDLPSLGVFRTQVVVTGEAGRQTQTLPRVFIAPWWFVVLASMLVLAVIAIGVALLVRRRRQWNALLDAAAADEAALNAPPGEYDVDDDVELPPARSA